MSNRKNTWILGATEISAIRGRSPAWQVRETIGKHPASCRECGNTIGKGERRFMFQLTALRSVLITGHHRQSSGHIHAKPCSKGQVRT
jgi:hypothetical protein